MLHEFGPEANHPETERAIVAHYTNPKLALVDAGITLHSEDRLTNTVYAIGGVLKLERAPLIHVVDGKKKRDVRSWVPTVTDLIAEKGIPEIGHDDKVTPDETAVLTHNMTVTIVRVQETDVVEKQTIAFATIEKTDATLERGKTRVDQEGHNGTKLLTYHVRREDGDEVSRKLTKTEIPTQKQDRIVVKGTKLIIGRTLKGNASWYKSAYAAASHVFKRGTRVRVTNTLTKKSLELTIEDYMESADKVIDLHPAHFTALGVTLGAGIQPVLVEEVLN